MKRILLSIFGSVLGILLLLALAIVFYPRPENLTPAYVYQGDAHSIDYCDLPVLDGSGLVADDIPQGHTPGCGYEKFPMPILAGCTEPLPEEATDMRGLWMIKEGSPGRPGHFERIEQCGNRFVVTSSRLIHDMTTDGELAGASNDVIGIALGSSGLCLRSTATTEWVEGRLQFYALGLVPVVARYMEGGVYKWDFPKFGTTAMKRICKLPEGA
jgi:hypothetical protein